MEVIPDARASSSTPSLRTTAVAAERELQKLRGKVDTTPTNCGPTSANGRVQRPDNDHTSPVDQWQRQDSYKQDAATKEWRSEEWNKKGGKNKRKKGKSKVKSN